MEKSLDRKLADIHRDPHGSKEFILADAKDPDMAFGIGAPGRSPESHPGEVRYRTLAEFRQQIREIVQQADVDILLMSAHTNDVLTIQERLFDNSPITPAGRANDTSDIFILRGSKYHEEPSRPFRTASIDHLQCGHQACAADERHRGANLGLYSITFNNRLEFDLPALEAYREFRIEAEQKGFRHFLELFDPNNPSDLTPQQVAPYINDAVARTLAGVAQAGRPLFLKMVYHGPKAMEELVAYDPHLVVGILGGSAGTTYDAFKLLSEAKAHGARVALYGRKINNAEHQVAFIKFLRLIADGQITAEEAVRAYHGVLQNLGIRPHRDLQADMELQTAVMSYGGNSAQVRVTQDVPAAKSESQKPEEQKADGKKCGCGCKSQPTATPAKEAGCGCSTPAPTTPASSDGTPDFATMTVAEKQAYQKARRDRIFGKFY